MSIELIAALSFYIIGMPMCIRMAWLHNKIFGGWAPRATLFLAAALWPILSAFIAIIDLHEFMSERQK